jgi:type IV secretion system protein TrbL
MQVASKFVEATSLWSPTASLGLLLSALVVIVCFALIAAFLILALVESYVVISAGVLFMGFGGSRWTKDFAVKILVYAVSVGAKLFILQLLVALGAQIFTDLAASVETNNASLFVIIGSSIVLLALTKIIPEMIQGLINGTSFGGGSAMTSTAAGAVAVGASAAVATRGAGRLASEQLAAQETPPAGGAMGRGVWMAGAMARNLSEAVLDNIGQRLGGRAAHGTRLGQSGMAMHEQANDMQRARRRNNQQTGQNNGGEQ